jgi:hypothetical protein
VLLHVPGFAATGKTGALPNFVLTSVWCSILVAFLTALARTSSGRVSTCQHTKHEHETLRVLGL